MITDPYELTPDYFTALKSCAAAIDLANPRRILHGVLHRKNYMTATDGFLLLLSQMPPDLVWEKDLVLPGDGIDALFKVFGKEEATFLHFDAAKKALQYQSAHSAAYVRCMDAPYPDLSKLLMPVSQSDRVGLEDTTPWIAELEEIIQMYKKEKTSDTYVVHLFFDKHRVEITARTESINHQNVLSTSADKTFTIHVDARRLKKAIQYVGNRSTLHYSAVREPFLLESEDGLRKAVVMPIWMPKEELRS
jgi:hypothetical protein